MIQGERKDFITSYGYYYGGGKEEEELLSIQSSKYKVFIP
jgi:hypothetical protein